jgi:bifunctional DNA-binding transcriptional regulator/antitoxin component of YhaV-PrlF toxin-antitoxin module
MNSQSQMMTQDESLWIGEVAGRLRLIQADTAEAPAEKRREFLQEEITRHLKPVPAANRRRYLQALLARFPIGGEIGRAAPVAQAAPPPEPKPLSPEEKIEQFFDLVSKLAPERRAEVSKRLVEAGLAPAAVRSEPIAQIPNELRQRLGLSEGKEASLTRVIELAAALVEIVARLDQAGLNAMRELSQKSKLLRRPEDFRTATARYLAGESESLEPYLRAIASLLGSMIAALMTGGREFGRQYLERLSPTAIHEVVVADGEYSSMVVGKSKQHCCWEKYKLLVDDFGTPDLIDRRIKDCMTAIIEKPVR